MNFLRKRRSLQVGAGGILFPLSLLLFSLTWTPLALSATVMALGRTFVVIDAGARHGVNRGERVCIINSKGEEVGCGSVGDVRPRMSEVRLPSWTAERVKTGDHVEGRTLKGGPTGDQVSQSELSAFVQALIRLEGPSHAVAAPVMPLVVAPSIDRRQGLPPATLWFRRVRVKPAVVATIRLPFWYRVPKYQVHSELDGDESLWEQDKQWIRTPWGGEFACSVPFSDHLALATTGHFRLLPDEDVTTSYDLRDPALGTVNRLRGRTYGVGIDLEYGWPLLAALEVVLSGGLEVDLSRLEFRQITMAPLEEQVVASLTSRLLVGSFRVGMGFAWTLGGGFALDVGAKAILPHREQRRHSVSVAGLKETISVSQKEHAEMILQETLNHKKAKIGMQVSLGLSYGF